ncbi:MAG: hypothetical protein V4850_29450 [Myxococcota bacterium]
MAATPVLALNLACSAALVGLVWTVGVAVYPLYAHIGPESFAAYHHAWTAAITLVVAPLMLAELVAAGLLCREAPRLGVALLVPVVLAWAVTAFWAVPMHGRLDVGFVQADWRSLCLANHVRAVAWTLRAGVLLGVAVRR